MQIKIRNYRGGETADIELSSVSLIVGPNAAGKSSLCEAAALTLAREPHPIGLKKSDAKALVGSPGGNASCRIEAGESEVVAEWPACEITEKGSAPRASLLAAGLVNPMEMKAADRAKALAKGIGAEPTRDDLKGALEAKGFVGLLDPLWKKVEDGWDQAYQGCKEKGIRLKGQWEGIAGERYGGSKAETWKPEGLIVEGEPSEIDFANAIGGQTVALNEAKRKLEGAISRSALDQKAREDLAALAGRMPLEEEIRNARAVLSETTQTLDKLKEKRRELPSPEQDQSIPCPHCKKAIHVSLQAGKFALAKAEKVSDKELKERRLSVAELDGKIENQAGLVAKAAREMAACWRMSFISPGGSRRTGPLPMSAAFCKISQRCHSALKPCAVLPPPSGVPESMFAA